MKGIEVDVDGTGIGVNEMRGGGRVCGGRICR